MIYTFEIPGTLPTLNQYVDMERTNRFVAAKAKRATQDEILWSLMGHPEFDGHVYIAFTWVRPNMRNDKDNVAFAKKFILDALQEAGVIKNDSWRMCTPFDLAFKLNKDNPRTIVTIADTLEEIYGDTHA